MENRLCRYACAFCGEVNDSLVDLSAGRKQSYVEDCAACCRPNVLTIRIDWESGEVSISSEFEG
ncbi:MAG TPA: CPXCG motif-containing cysteine-rich protein [Bacteroidetes bacterium]|nr:CPXCG motif-containing cysteine-rich protein [Bacteroidota bacterium]